MPRLLLLSFLTLVLAGCGSDSPAGTPDAGAGAGGDGGDGGSAGFPDGGFGGGLGCDEQPAMAGALGGRCRGEAMTSCNTGLECIPQIPSVIGGADNPIRDYPPGETVPIDAPLFLGTYCSLPVAGPTGCDPQQCFDQCGFCADGVCMNRCFPEVDSNSICRDGYACDLFDFVCFPGCTSDDECRVSVQGEELVYNTESSAVCSQVTYRCEHPGTPGSEAGDACVFDDDCEPNGVCLRGEDGYCSKIGCDVAGNGCAGDATCLGGLCLASCEIGADTMTDPLENTQGCRPGYTCYWDRLSENPDGVCDTGVFNTDVTENNIGAACAESSECFSPYGYGRCDNDLGFGCTVVECGAPGVPEDICGDNAVCIDFIDVGLDLFACLKRCATANDCNQGDACIDIDLNPETVDDQVCFPNCADTLECREGEVCDVNNTCVQP